MGLNPNALAWTPGLCSRGERSGNSPDRNGRTAHCVGMHDKREEGVESDGVGWLNLPVNQDKHRADKFSQRDRRKKRRRGRAKRRLARKAARVARARQKGRLVRVATYNVRTLAVKGANGYGRDYSILYEAARLDISVLGLQETRRAGRTEFAAGHHGVGLAVKESVCSNSTYTTEYVDERLIWPCGLRYRVKVERASYLRTHQPKSARTKPSKRSGIDLTVSYSGSRQRSACMC